VPTIYDLAGTWQHQSRTNPATLILRKDGTLAIANVPEGLLSQQLTQNGHLAAPFVTVSGTWTIGSDGTTRTKDGTPYLDLLTPSASYATAFYLYVAGSGKLLTLSQPYGDPDLYSYYNFER
jgi:hypothetical protein